MPPSEDWDARPPAASFCGQTILPCARRARAARTGGYTQNTIRQKGGSANLRVATHCPMHAARRRPHVKRRLPLGQDEFQILMAARAESPAIRVMKPRAMAIRACLFLVSNSSMPGPFFAKPRGNNKHLLVRFRHRWNDATGIRSRNPSGGRYSVSDNA